MPKEKREKKYFIDFSHFHVRVLTCERKKCLSVAVETTIFLLFSNQIFPIISYLISKKCYIYFSFKPKKKHENTTLN